MRKSFLPALLALVLCAIPAGAGGQRERTFTVYYTASLNGNLDGCTCRSAPKAGLVKRAVFLRTRNSGDSLLVDTGDILDVAPDAELTREILEVYRELRYDAIAVGDQDLSNGVEAFREIARRYPFRSNNLAILVDDRQTRISSGPLTLRRGGLTVEIGALIDPAVFVLYPESFKKRIRVFPVRKSAETLLQQMEKERADLRVLLYHGSVEQAETLARSVPGFDLIIVGHEQRLVDARRIGATILVSPGEEGNRVGILTYTREGSRLRNPANRFKLFQYTTDPDDPAVRRRIESYKELLRKRLNKGS